jgi:CheY-like chemotaxis protein
MARPPLASLDIPEVPEKESDEYDTSSRRPRRRSILIRIHSMPIPEYQPKGNLQEIVPILRPSTFVSMQVSLSPNNVESEGSAPSLMSLGDDEDSSHSSNEATPPVLDPKHEMRRSSSEPSSGKTITFDPRIWVREFERSQEEQETTWYSEDDMELFKRHALALIMSRKSTDIIPTGTARTVRRPFAAAKAFFTHSALTLDGEDDASEALQNEKYRLVVAQNEMKSILLVDPHDICLTLFTKALKTLLPNVEICAATSSDEALKYAATGKRFDIILVEERLKQIFHKQNNISAETKSADHCHSGSALFCKLSRMENTHNALFIGVSARLEKDRSTLEEGGADFCWSKPPPKMSEELRNGLLKTLLLKRGRKTISDELFGSS